METYKTVKLFLLQYKKSGVKKKGRRNFKKKEKRVLEVVANIDTEGNVYNFYNKTRSSSIFEWLYHMMCKVCVIIYKSLRNVFAALVKIIFKKIHSQFHSRYLILDLVYYHFNHRLPKSPILSWNSHCVNIISPQRRVARSTWLVNNHVIFFFISLDFL